MRGALGLLAVAASARALAAAPSGEAIFAARCASCHDAPPSADNRAPPKAVLEQMSVARIVRAMDFGAMMSLTYMLDRAEREAVAAYLGVPGEDRAPPPSAFCTQRTVAVAKPDAGDWNGWSPAATNTRYQARPGISAAQLGRLQLKWAFGFAGDVNAFAPPAVLGANLFVGSAGGSIYALDARSGCIHWHYQADGPVRTAMLVAPLDAGGARHAVLFGDQAGRFYAVSAETGALLWRARPDEHEATKLTGAPLARDGVVYVPVASWEESRPLNPAYECCTFRGSVVAYRIANGERIWQSFLVAETPKAGERTEQGVLEWGPVGRRHLVDADARCGARSLVRHDGQQLHGPDGDERRSRRDQDCRRRRRVVEAADAGRRVQSVVQSGRHRLSRHGLRHRRIGGARAHARRRGAALGRPEVGRGLRPRSGTTRRARLADARRQGRHQRRDRLGARERRPQRVRGGVGSRTPRARRRNAVRLAAGRRRPIERRRSHRARHPQRRKGLVRASGAVPTGAGRFAAPRSPPP